MRPTMNGSATEEGAWQLGAVHGHRQPSRARESDSELRNAKTTLVAESGIHTRADVERLASCGVNAILVGESLMRSADIPAKVQELIGGA